jgi:hypothetical protein
MPSRTRPSKSSAPMVLSLKAWKSRSLPGLPKTEHPHHDIQNAKNPGVFRGAFCLHPSWRAPRVVPRGSFVSLLCFVQRTEFANHRPRGRIDNILTLAERDPAGS